MKAMIQFGKYAIVGLSNTAISLAVYYTLLSFGVNYLIANFTSFILSVMNAYYWSSKYVFKSDEGWIKTLARVYISYGFTFLLSMAALYFMVEFIGISEELAPLSLLFVTVPINFIVNKFWAFKD